MEFVRLLGLEKEIRINEVSSDFFKQDYYAPRPASEKLLNLKLTARRLNVMRDWRVCLSEYSKCFLEHLNASRQADGN
jgi:dTDP-4-dehydrorhamnose reductase